MEIGQNEQVILFTDESIKLLGEVDNGTVYEITVPVFCNKPKFHIAFLGREEIFLPLEKVYFPYARAVGGDELALADFVFPGDKIRIVVSSMYEPYAIKIKKNEYARRY